SFDSVAYLHILFASSTFFFFSIPLKPRSPLFPYTTLFRSHRALDLEPSLERVGHRVGDRGRRRPGRALADATDAQRVVIGRELQDRKSTRLNSSHDQISYAVFRLKKTNGKQKVVVLDIRAG